MQEREEKRIIERTAKGTHKKQWKITKARASTEKVAHKTHTAWRVGDSCLHDRTHPRSIISSCRVERPSNWIFSQVNHIPLLLCGPCAAPNRGANNAKGAKWRPLCTSCWRLTEQLSWGRLPLSNVVCGDTEQRYVYGKLVLVLETQGMMKGC